MESEKVKEIKKVLECCYILTNKDLPMETRDNACNNCPYDGIERCSPLLVENSLTYINELESENERLGNESNEMFDKYGKELQIATILIEKRNNEIIELKDRIAELEKENMILQGTKNRLTFTDRIKIADNARTIALKQFAERLKEITCEMYLKEQLHHCIDETLKELQGE